MKKVFALTAVALTGFACQVIAQTPTVKPVGKTVPSRSPVKVAGKVGKPSQEVRIIPRTYEVNAVWVDQSRDPFMDASKRGKDTLIANRPPPAPASKPLGYDTGKFVADLRSAGSGEGFKVDSVLPGYGSVPTVVVVNGQSFAQGDYLPVRVHTEDFESFQAIAKSKRLEFEKTASRTSTRPVTPPAPGTPKVVPTVPADLMILLQVGRIVQPDSFGPGGVELRVPGYSAALVVVPLKFPPRLQANPSTASASSRR